MTKGKSSVPSFFNLKIIILFLTFFTLKVNSETKIIANNGDTLFKLSQEYGVSLKELMHKNNINNANTIVEGEVIIIPLENNNIKPLTYRVNKGETLYKIARDHKVNMKDIISINNFTNESVIKENQIILLPNWSNNKTIMSPKNINLARKKVFFHQTSKIEKISEIAQIHDVRVDEIIHLNKLNNPIKIDPNTKIAIRKSESEKWLRYGSLRVNWAEWVYLDNYYLTQAKNKRNKSFYLAINCQKRLLNNTLKNALWTSWYFPKIDFEFKLINDFCDQDFEV